MINLLLLTRPLHNPTQINNYHTLAFRYFLTSNISITLKPKQRVVLTRQIKRKIHTSQHNRQQNIPPTQTRHKRKRARRFLTLRGHPRIPLRSVQESAGEKTESGDEREEDEEEDEVGADTADQVDYAEEGHADHEVGC